MQTDYSAIDRRIEELGGVEPNGAPPFFPVRRDELAHYATQRNVTLPDDFVYFLSRYGDCHFVGNASFDYRRYVPLTNKELLALDYLPIRRTDGGGCIDGFVGVSPSHNPKSLWNPSRVDTEWLQPTLQPIGRDGMGNAICLGVDGEELGKVFFWVHDEELELEDFETNGSIPRDVRFFNVYWIADSFEDFLNALAVDFD